MWTLWERLDGEWCVVNDGFKFGATLAQTLVRGLDLDLTIVSNGSILVNQFLQLFFY